MSRVDWILHGCTIATIRVLIAKFTENRRNSSSLALRWWAPAHKERQGKKRKNLFDREKSLGWGLQLMSSILKKEIHCFDFLKNCLGLGTICLG